MGDEFSTQKYSGSFSRIMVEFHVHFKEKDGSERGSAKHSTHTNTYRNHFTYRNHTALSYLGLAIRAGSFGRRSANT